MITLHHGHAFDVLEKLGGFGMIFADPPDNAGLKYNGFEDKFDDYESFMLRLIELMYDHAPISWLSFNAKWMGVVGKIVNTLVPDNHRFFIQTFTFGQNRRKDFTNGYRPLLRLMHSGAPIYPERVKVASWRQLNGDKRAAKGGKIPDDVWDFPRVTGNSKQRRTWSPTQLHEGIYQRAIDFSCPVGSKICDLFAGSGTMARVADETHDVHLIEISDQTINHLYEEHGPCDLLCYQQSFCSVCH